MPLSNQERHDLQFNVLGTETESNPKFPRSGPSFMRFHLETQADVVIRAINELLNLISSMEESSISRINQLSDNVIGNIFDSEEIADQLEQIGDPLITAVLKLKLKLNDIEQLFDLPSFYESTFQYDDQGRFQKEVAPGKVSTLHYTESGDFNSFVVETETSKTTHSLVFDSEGNLTGYKQEVERFETEDPVEPEPESDI